MTTRFFKFETRGATSARTIFVFLRWLGENWTTLIIVSFIHPREEHFNGFKVTAVEDLYMTQYLREKKRSYTDLGEVENTIRFSPFHATEWPYTLADSKFGQLRTLM